MLATLKTVLNFVVAGALIGILAASWAGPGYVEWDNRTGPTDTGTCFCSRKAREGAEQMLTYQKAWGGVGAGVGLLASIGFLFWKRSRAKKANAVGTSVSSLRS